MALRIVAPRHRPRQRPAGGAPIRRPMPGSPRRASKVLAALAATRAARHRRPGARRRRQRRRDPRHGRRRSAARRRCCRSPRRSPIPDPDHPGQILSPDQEAAAAVAARRRWRRAHSRVTLLDGVTGSGKTEVYLEAIAECLRQGRQALVLLPEIALSSQWLERFERRFGVAPAVWHSDLTSRVRRITWRAVAAGAAPVVVGARSALFLPFPDLGPGGDRRGARDGVQAGGGRRLPRPRHGGGARPVLLGAGRPGLRHPVAWRRWPMSRPAAIGGITLPTRHGGAMLPSVAAIDLRATPPERGHFLAPPLIAAIRDTLARGEQAHAVPQPPRLCAADAVPRAAATGCSARTAPPGWWSTASRRALQCHHCGHAVPIPDECPACEAATQPGAGRPGRGAHHRGGRGTVPGRAAAGDGQRHDARPARRRRRRARDRGARGGPDHRHPDRRQGLAFSASDAGGRGRRRSGPGRRRSARGRADGAAAAPGRRSRRAGRGAGPGAAADVLARSTR